MDELSECKKKISVLEQQLALYEQNGTAKLYYALTRKMNEMANILNSTSLQNIALDDPKDKTFERIRFIINDSSGIATASKALGEAAGVTGNEHNDTRKLNQRTTPESIADELGDNKKQDV